LLSVPKQIVFFVTDEALAGLGPPAAAGQFRRKPQLGQGRLEPRVDSTVTFRGANGVPLVAGRKSQAIGPVRVVRHQPSARRPTDKRPKQGEPFNLRIPLKITK